jgi:hypothetical protein
MIDRKNVQLVVFDWRGPLIPPLARWAAGFPRPWFLSQFGDEQRRPLPNQRNFVWRQFLHLDTAADWLLMVDDDQVPVPETEALFEQQYPHAVVGARYFGKCGFEVHQADGFVGGGCMMVHRLAAEMIGDDPFTLGPDDPCDCLPFCRRAQAAGFWPKKVGAIGHRCVVDVLPAEKGEYKVRFPKAIALSRHGPLAEPHDEALVPPPRNPVGGHGSLLVLPDGLVDGHTCQRYQDVGIDGR